jgi:hypothetical protein
LSGEWPASRDSILSGECPVPQEPLVALLTVPKVSAILADL